MFNWSSGGINPAAVEAMVNLRGAYAEKSAAFKIELAPVDVVTLESSFARCTTTVNVR